MSSSPIFDQPLPWMEPGAPFPPVDDAWNAQSPAPGLLAAGGDLSVPTLRAAYSQGIFPWYSAGQPVLWWSTDPRMVLRPERFRLHRSLRKTLARLLEQERLEIRIDQNFARVIRACATSPRPGQNGTWILPVMVQAYERLHAAGNAHSVETWIDGELAGGLYCVSLGAAVFGESMFSRRTDASKVALVALVERLLERGFTLLDTQWTTDHLKTFGCLDIPRADYLERLEAALAIEADFAAEVPRAG